MKCIIDPSSGEPCKRCAKAGRQCIVTPPTRKRQKKADSRVAELERKIDALTATLAQRDGKLPDEYGYSNKRTSSEVASYESSPVQNNTGSYSASQTVPGEYGPNKRLRLDRVSRIGPLVHCEPNDEGQPYTKYEPVMAGLHDPNGEGTPTAGSVYNEKGPTVYDHSDLERKLDEIIDPDDAERLFDRYVTKVVPNFPAVPFPPGTTAKTVRKEKPILFLAILSGTSYGANIPATTQTALEKELREVFATCMWKNGEKNLQLIQALQVCFQLCLYILSPI